MEHNEIYDEISLRELIEALLKRKKMIAVITAISIIVTGVFSFLILKPTYESSMILMASDAAENKSVESLNGNVEQMLDSIAKYPAMNIETYRQQVNTPEVLSKTINDLGLEEDYTIQSLSNSITLETVKDTQLIKINVKNGDPEKAARIANKIGENFIVAVTNNAKSRASTTSNYLLTQMEVEKTKYDEALLEQKTLLSEPRGANELSMEINALLGQLTQYKTNINNYSIRKEALVASIAVAEATPGNGSSLILNQNTGRVLLDNSETTLKIELAEVESNLKSTSNKIEELQNELEKLQIEYQDKSHREGIVNQKVNIAQSTYESFVKKYEELRVAESAHIGDSSITIISRAHSNPNPIAPRKALNVAIGGVLGVMVGVFVAFFIEYWQATDKKDEKVSKNAIKG